MHSSPHSLARRLPRLIILPAIAIALAAGTLAYLRAHHSLDQAAQQLVLAKQSGRTHQLEQLLSSISKNLQATAANPRVREAAREFSTEFARLGDQAGSRLADLYITKNPNPPAERFKLDDAGDGSDYSARHARYNPDLREICQRGGYYDLFLIDPAGNVVFTVFKEPDFGSNLQNGPWKETGLAQAARDVLAHPRKDHLAFRTYEAYAPSNGVAAAFLAAPILNPLDGSLEFVVAIQFPGNLVSDILQDSAGLGSSGESFIVGQDHFLHSDSRFSRESTILKRKVGGEAVEAALAGRTGILATVNSADVPVISAFGPLEFLGNRWALLTEISQQEVAKPAHQLLWQLLVGVALAGLGMAWLGRRLAAGLTRPFQDLGHVLGQLAEGELDSQVPGVTRDDELGEIARAVEILRQHGLELKRMEEAQRLRESQASEERRRLRVQLAEDFMGKVGRVVHSVGAASEQLQMTAESMAALSEQTSGQAGGVAAAAEEGSVNLGTVAAATEQLSSSVHEINRQVRLSSEIAVQAVAQSLQADQTVARLQASVSRIGEVAGLIRGVADQTNLLALNATIEAARAGDAGRGFAVVADEVKLLAGQTTRATEDIHRQIQAIQQDTQAAVESLRSIAQVIRENDQIVTGIAGAMEQQGATTLEIAHNVEQAARGTREVSENVHLLSTAAQESSSASAQVLGAAQELGLNASQLQRELEDFLQQVRLG